MLNTCLFVHYLEHVRYLEDEQLALMLQNDEFLAVLMSDSDFVQALERGWYSRGMAWHNGCDLMGDGGHRKMAIATIIL